MVWEGGENLQYLARKLTQSRPYNSIFRAENNKIKFLVWCSSFLSQSSPMILFKNIFLSSLSLYEKLGF